MPDLAKIKRNVEKMRSMNAPPQHIQGYLTQEKVTMQDLMAGGGEPISQIADAVSGQPTQPVFQTPYGQMQATKVTGAKPTFEPYVSPQQKQKESLVEAQAGAKKQMLAQRSKDIMRSQQDLSKVENTIGTTFDQWIDNIKWNYDEYGIKPGGPISGVMTKVLGKTRGNPYWEGFQGSLLEYGAGLARIAMPGIRAARSIAMFQKSAPSDWSTLESGINNIAASFRNAVGTDISRHPNDYLDVLGQDFMGLPPEKKYERKREYLSGLEERFEEGSWRQINKKIPELTPKKMKKKLEQVATMEEMGIDPSEWEIQ